MHRHALTDQEWERLQAVLPKRRSGPEAIRGDRLFVDAVVYRAKTGMPWRVVNLSRSGATIPDVFREQLEADV